jgi:D-serine deaminase-like pyridoxal phosphate-dependent protein
MSDSQPAPGRPLPPGGPPARRLEEVLEWYGGSIGRRVEEVPTPALLLDLGAAERNIARMAAALEGLSCRIRPHVKTHKCAELAARQVAAGAIGISTATVSEAVALAWAGIDDLFVVNTISHPEKLRVLAGLARSRRVLVAADDEANAGELSRAAARAGSELGVLVEVDDGMDRCGVDSAREALALAEAIVELPHLRFEGVTGYEGHCSLEPDAGRRAAKQRDAMGKFLDAAEALESAGIACPIRSAGGTATWELTAARAGVTEIQAGTYVLMDNFHAPMAGGFEHALHVGTTVISRTPGRVVLDAGNKSVGVGGGPSIAGTALGALRFDEEHGVFDAGPECELAVGDWVALVPGYTPGTVNLYDAYHVVEQERVVDIWPVFPRGPGHQGLLAPP